MSAADKIAEAPERIWITGESCLWSSSRHFHASNLDHSNDDGTCDYPEYVRADLTDGWEAEKARADALAQEVSELQEALRERDGGAHDADCRALRPAPHARPCNCGHDRAVYVLGATP